MRPDNPRRRETTAGNPLQTLSAAVAELVKGELQTITVYSDGRWASEQPARGAILSGAFNPLHEGHIRLAAIAARRTGLPIFFELPVANADKGLISAEEVQRRLRQFRDKHPVLLSRAPLFSQKARLYPDSVFVIGYDTAIRIVAPRYYDGEAGMLAAFAKIREAGCRFLVGGRVQDDRFCTLANIDLPPAIRDLFDGLSEQEFRADLSSTELRAMAHS